jgi:hypothetical protein
MTWNYRVMRKGDQVAIHEVFYREDGSFQGYTKDPVFPRNQSKAAIRGVEALCAGVGGTYPAL